jgi:hypothetical protein
MLRSFLNLGAFFAPQKTGLCGGSAPATPWPLRAPPIPCALRRWSFTTSKTPHLSTGVELLPCANSNCGYTPGKGGVTGAASDPQPPVAVLRPGAHSQMLCICFRNASIHGRLGCAHKTMHRMVLSHRGGSERPPEAGWSEGETSPFLIFR